jgi:hypothetical protein
MKYEVQIDLVINIDSEIDKAVREEYEMMFV